ncbi:dynamin family protein [Virgibacillus necropolis]|uniref:dynamin family protein n=1 Tax=Virgibacillus necropolis TaxID=163877 RepID=UPI0013747966|nr:dynamin family protein [Virgibacillus necropolis]
MPLLKDQHQPITKHHLASLYTLLRKEGDKDQAQNSLDLYEKLEKQELVISFAGHFSAGKSSIINELLEKSLLPHSPIPTSANLVKIYSGGGFARVHFHHEKTVEYSEPYDIDVIKAYCQDKDSIKKIEISSSDSILPASTALLDTPGIDAADDADRLITEGSLHLVDALFYVMDYNHVQSEVNLQFLQSIQEKDIPFFLIINQIDKHNADELAFSTYQDKIKQTFNQWEIYPEETFYTSLIEQSISDNQLDLLKDFLSTLLLSKKDSYYSLVRSVTQIIDDHKRNMEKQYNEEIEMIKAESNDYEANVERIEEIKEQLDRLKNRPAQFDKEFNQTINTTLENAYIMPATLRDQALAYLESQQPDFKVGLFGSKKKTEEEKSIRLHNFLKPLQENIKKSIQWKLRDKIIQQMKSFDITDPSLIQKVQDLSIDYTGNDLDSLIKRGAKVNGDSVLNYTKDISNDIKKKYRRETIDKKDTILSYLTDQSSNQISSYQKELADLEKAESATNQIANLVDERDAKLNRSQEVLLNSQLSDAEWNTINQSLKERNNVIKQDAPQVKRNKSDHVEFTQRDEQVMVEASYTVDDVVEGINQTLDVIESSPGFDQLIADLKTKQEKLAKRSFTITLFGAFSAGKSSFANALIGESVLPVSPNPTTAAINRIVPVTDEHSHGSVVVTMKDEKTIMQDSLALLKGFSPNSDSIDSLHKWLTETNIRSLPKTQQHYLQAIIDGFGEMKNHIGGHIQTTIDEFSVYVTEETKACFVESIDLYYDCSLTQQGITLVDTPGADSVNARHTSVAFDYIKYADAILYVTYYNHALSRADKDFLMQLGRVKESFELDKMFFIINAADLAKNENELLLVENYVNEQLVQLGIRFPRLFPISSRITLANKQAKEPLNDYMYHFEEQFYQFIHHDLTKLSIDSAIWDMKWAYHVISSYLASVKMSEQEKMHQKDSVRTKKEEAFRVINELDKDSYTKAIIQKIDKQLYYVLDRLSIRFHDMFKGMFNPTMIQESGKAGKIQIDNSMQELLDYVGYELLQELRAVSLRIEAQIRELVEEIGVTASEKINTIDERFVLPSGTKVDLSTPNFTQAFNQLKVSAFSKALSSYKGPKSFFEKNEKEQMKEAIFSILKPYAKEYLDSNKQVMEVAYDEQWVHTMEQIKGAYMRSIESYTDGLLRILSDKDNEIELANKESELASIMKNYDNNLTGEEYDV